MRPAPHLFRLGLACLLFCQTIGCVSVRNPFKPISARSVRSGDLARDANAAMEQGNWEEAEKKFEEAIRLSDGDVGTKIPYAEALWMRGRRDESLALLYQVAERSTKLTERVDAAASAATKLTELGMDEKAVSWAEQCIREAPHDYRGWWFRGRAQMRIGYAYDRAGAQDTAKELYIQARDGYFRALAFQPPEREILPELGRLQILLREPEHALATWQNLQRLYIPGTEPVELLHAKGETLAMIGRAADAAECFAMATARHSGESRPVAVNNPPLER